MDTIPSNLFVFREPHLSLFRESQFGRWRSKKAGKWSSATGYRFRRTYSPDDLAHPLERADLVRLRDNRHADVLDLCVFVFAWGGMKIPDGSALLKSCDHEWISVSEGVHQGTISIREGYDYFQRLSTSGKMPGCGPAYYTKLLFFLPRSGLPRGIIMDQWTARSINLLTGTQLVSVRGSGRSGWVLPSNGVGVYEAFCTAVIALATEIGASIEETEIRLFSQGGRTPAIWRKHVIERT